MLVMRTFCASASTGSPASSRHRRVRADESATPVTSDLAWMSQISLISTGCRPWTGHPFKPDSTLALPKRRAPAVRTATLAG